jgi:hypothetical protein
MSVNNYADNLGSAVRYALTTTVATTVCPFHTDMTIRVGDDAAESHAFARARKIIKTDGTKWEREVLMEEFGRQLIGAGAERAVKPRNLIRSGIEKSERQNPETRPILLSSGLLVFATTVQD